MPTTVATLASTRASSRATQPRKTALLGKVLRFLIRLAEEAEIGEASDDDVAVEELGPSPEVIGERPYVLIEERPQPDDQVFLLVGEFVLEAIEICTDCLE